MADHQRRHPQAADARRWAERSGRRGSPRARRATAQGPGARQSSPTSTSWCVRGIRLVTEASTRNTGSPKRSAISIGVKTIAAPSRALSSTGISMNSAPARSGWREASSRPTLAPSEVPPTTGASRPRWSNRRDQLLGEGEHVVEPRVGGAPRAAVAEEVDRDNAVAARGKLRAEPLVHAPVHQQAVREHDHAVALAVDVVGDLVSRVAKRALLGSHARQVYEEAWAASTRSQGREARSALSTARTPAARLSA